MFAMRIPAAIAAASLTLAPATPVEQLLSDVSATHESSVTAINSAETDEEVREALISWRKELIAAADELAELREEAAEDGLTDEEKDTFDKAAAEIKRERAGVRELRAELLPDDAPVVVPAPLEGLGGLLGTTAFDAYERSDNGDTPIVFGIPGAQRTEATEITATSPETTTTAPATTRATKPTVAKEPTAPSTAAAFGPEVTHRVERLQDSDDSEETAEETTTATDSSTTSTTTSASETTTATASNLSGSSTTSSATTTTPSSTTSASTTSSSSSSRSVMQNRTTSATSSSSSSTTTSKTSSSTSKTTTSDDERDGDLADTGTPMRGLIAAGTLALLLGATLVLTGMVRPRGSRK